MGKANDHLDVFAVFMIQDAFAADTVSRAIGLGTRAEFVDPVANRAVVRRFQDRFFTLIFQFPPSLLHLFCNNASPQPFR